MFNPLKHPICLSNPELVAPSGWEEHAPFGAWLISATRPRLIVELGVNFGRTYCFFCQTVKNLELTTKCVGVDSWGHDEHIGKYGEETYQNLKQFHDERYSSFSSLVRSMFADAVDRFENGSIDILHIDGTHSYEAAKEDFENYLPKVSKRGIVLFHDINANGCWLSENGKPKVWVPFEVHKLWKELKESFPKNFTFMHGFGLGVLAVGETNPDLDELFDAGPEERETIAWFFHQLGWASSQAAEAEILRRRIEAKNHS